MNELLESEGVRVALVALVVCVINALVSVVNACKNWVLSKFPSQEKLIEANWCYLQEAAKKVWEKSRGLSLEENKGDTQNYNANLTAILWEGVDVFYNTYQALEREEPADKEMDAVISELAMTIKNATGVQLDIGGKVWGSTR